jgi:geranylgeranyl reductase family protein
LLSQRNAEVIVVGAGPAGATAAYFLAKAGVDVFLLDQATFPRDKSCGDGLGYHAVRMLEKMGLGDWIRRNDHNPNQQFLLSSPDGTSAVAPSPPDVRGYSYTVPRVELDVRLVEAAVGADATLHQRTRVTALERLTPDMVRVVSERETYSAPLVIAADGGNVSFTRRLGLAPRLAEWVAARAYYEGDTGDPHQLEIHWEPSVLPGYCWIFPSGGGRVNVGVGAYSRDVREQRLNLSAMLETFVVENPHARARLGNAQRVTPIIGHPLRADAPDVTAYADNVLVAGEAAGLVSPLTGEGIGNSMVSGEMAAQAAIKALEHGEFSSTALAAYGRDFHMRFDAPHRAARLARSMLNRAWILNRSLRRAARDHDYAVQLNRILVGQRSPATLFAPGMALKTLLG